VTKVTTPDALPALAEGLAAVVSPEGFPLRQQSVAATVGVLGGTGLSWAAVPLAQPALEPLPPPLPTQTLVDLLKQPLCVGEARRLVLDQLSRHYRRPFADQWEFVEYAQEQQLALDLLSPPVPPTRP
jgi:hypothetical protein